VGIGLANLDLVPCNLRVKLKRVDPPVKTSEMQLKRCHGSGTFPMAKMGQFYIGSHPLWA